MTVSDEDLVGETVRICHVHGRIREAVEEDAYQVSVMLGDVHQHITVTASYAQENLVE